MHADLQQLQQPNHPQQQAAMAPNRTSTRRAFQVGIDTALRAISRYVCSLTLCCPSHALSTLQDVTNASRSGAQGKAAGGKATLPTKRSTGVKTRSMGGSNASNRGVNDSSVLDAAPERSVRDREERDSEPSMEDDPMMIGLPPLPPALDPNHDPDSYQMTGTVDNIDVRDEDDVLCVTEYVQDMYTLFREKEKTTSVRPVYMKKQQHINERMRAILVDWLIEVHLKFKLVPETLHLTINLIDRYLSLQEVNRPKLQLVGVTSLLIASKYEEIYPPELRDLVYICDRAYTRADVSFCFAFFNDPRCSSPTHDICRSRTDY
jgi:Cyclin, N-terminal domain